MVNPPYFGGVAGRVACGSKIQCHGTSETAGADDENTSCGRSGPGGPWRPWDAMNQEMLGECSMKIGVYIAYYRIRWWFVHIEWWYIGLYIEICIYIYIHIWATNDSGRLWEVYLTIIGGIIGQKNPRVSSENDVHNLLLEMTLEMTWVFPLIAWWCCIVMFF